MYALGYLQGCSKSLCLPQPQGTAVTLKDKWTTADFHTLDFPTATTSAHGTWQGGITGRLPEPSGGQHFYHPSSAASRADSGFQQQEKQGRCFG